MRPLHLVLTLVIFLLAGVNAFLLFGREDAACKGCNVLVISIEALGMEETDLLDTSTELTPNLKDFADKHGIVFERTYAQAPWTIASHASLMTGRYPWDLGVWDGLDRLPEHSPTLATRLARAGYETALFSNGFVHQAFGFATGFETVRGELVTKSGPDQIMKDALDWLDAHTSDTPFFLFVHTNDVALPYGNVTAQEIADMHTQEEGPSAEQSARVQSAYHAEVQKVDFAVGAFLEELVARGLLENTIVVITSGNGQRFDDRNELGLHAGSLSEESLRVPLVLAIPSQEAARIRSVVELRSVASTLLALVGIPYEETSLGESLLPILTGSEVGNRIALAATAKNHSSVIEGLRVTDRVLAEIEEGREEPIERLGPFQQPYTMTALSTDLKVVRGFSGETSVFAIEKDTTVEKEVTGSHLRTRQIDIVALTLRLLTH